MPPGDFVGRLHTAGEPPNVVISGWRIYDNKGHVVEEFEPFFSVGWEYRSPVSEPEQSGRNVAGVRVSTFYDPRGQVVRSVNADGSERRIVFGVPGFGAAARPQ